MDSRERTRLNEEIGNFLRLHREISGMQMKEIAEKAKIPHTEYSRFENGRKRISALDFLRVCNIIGVDPNKVIDLIK